MTKTFNLCTMQNGHTTLEQQHREIVAVLNQNRSDMMPYLGKNVRLVTNEGKQLAGQVSAVGGYFISIKGLNGIFDESLRGNTKHEYRNLKSISLI